MSRALRSRGLARHFGVASGPCSISGPITGAPPGPVRVYLLDRSMSAVRAVRVTGASYLISKVGVGEWTVVARDESGTFAAVVADRIKTVLE